MKVYTQKCSDGIMQVDCLLRVVDLPDELYKECLVCHMFKVCWYWFVHLIEEKKGFVTCIYTFLSCFVQRLSEQS